MTQLLSPDQSTSRHANFALWEKLSRDNGFVETLTPEDGFRFCFGTQRAWADKVKSGIYFWIAEDGEGYVGQPKLNTSAALPSTN